MPRLLKIALVAAAGLVVLGIAGAAGGTWLIYTYGRGLPDYRKLAAYEPPTVTRIHAADGRLLAEYAREKRVFVPIEAVPKRLIQAFLAAEDKTFYSHPGVDLPGIVNAAFSNVARWRNNQRPIGASTITQQVAKNFLLTNEVSIERKIKEVLLALRIERAFTKDEILELYLNEIYLGVGSYGVAAAALNYFNRSLDELTTAETAFLAGLPKAPSRYHPRRQPEAALARRDWVLEQMRGNRFITDEEAEAALLEPIEMRSRAPTEVVAADFFTEEVRRELAERYGEDSLYEGGLSVRTTLDPRLQAITRRALRRGLIAYDRRHGWRGASGRIEILGDGWVDELDRTASARAVPAEGWELAVVLDAGRGGARIGLTGGREADLPLAEMGWAKRSLGNGRFGPNVETATQVVDPGDLVWTEWVEPDEGADDADRGGRYTLRQVPEVEGAAVALDPHTGRVFAMIGGFNYAFSQFNRATQAKRQPGSAFKPFVYLAALEKGFTPSSIILDAPIVIDQGPGLGRWKPENYSNRFYGPSTLRLGVEKSRNLMTVRLAQSVGMDQVEDIATRFGIAGGFEDPSRVGLATALGSGEVDLLHLTTAYAELVNGGKGVEPALIERIQNKHGDSQARRDQRRCEDCRSGAWEPGLAPPALPDLREQIVDAAHAYQVVSILEGVVLRGTGVRARSIGKPVAGKTGTSNESRDAWFIGFTPDLAVGVFVGFDQPRTLGAREQGASAALPIFVEIMTEALKEQPATPFRTPPGVRLVRIDGNTGLLPGPDSEFTLVEAFIPGTEPNRSSPPKGSGYTYDSGAANGTSGTATNGSPVVRQRPPQTGGLY